MENIFEAALFSAWPSKLCLSLDDNLAQAERINSRFLARACGLAKLVGAVKLKLKCMQSIEGTHTCKQGYKRRHMCTRPTI